MLKLCIWVNLVSHYQTAFFEALKKKNDIDLIVVYTKGSSQERLREGWRFDRPYQDYEYQILPDGQQLENLRKLPEWRDRIHIINLLVPPGILPYFCSENIRWAYWAELPGVNFAMKLRYIVPVFRRLYPLYLWWKRRDYRLIAEHALIAFGQGQMAIQAFYRLGIPKERCRKLFYAPLALQKLSPEKNIADFARGRKVFSSIGALCRRKGTDILLKAFAQLHTSDWVLVLVGNDRCNGYFQEIARKLGIADRVLFLGVYPAEKIASIYTASDVFVLASRFDGWGAVVNEAASLGVPSIASDLCGVSYELIENGINGYRVSANAPRKLAEAMRHYVEHPEWIAKHGAKAQQKFFAEFTPDKNAEMVYTSLKKYVR